MGFRSDSVTSWPALPLPGSNVTLRSNTDAGIVWVAGSFTATSSATIYFATFTGTPPPMPATFRPVTQVDLPSGAAALHVSANGECWVTVPGAGSYAWRTFYFTTVTPG